MTATPGDALTVLVVDDKPYIRQLVATALSLRGFRVLTAADGAEGVELAVRERPRVILLDLVMPGTDGYTAIERLRTDPATREIPVIVMSAKVETEAEPWVPGADDYLIKPFDLDVMEGKVEYFLYGRGAARGGEAGG